MRYRPTPETDRAERMAFSHEYMVPTEVAKKLERERDMLAEALVILSQFAPNNMVEDQYEKDVWRDALGALAAVKGGKP